MMNGVSISATANQFLGFARILDRFFETDGRSISDRKSAIAVDPALCRWPGQCGTTQKSHQYYREGIALTTNTASSDRKARIDALLLKLAGVSTRKINGLDAYFVSDKMFACLSGDGIGLRLPASTATELQFSRNDVVPFAPAGLASTREWIQINRADIADYENDLPLFEASREFVKTGKAG